MTEAYFEQIIQKIIEGTIKVIIGFIVVMILFKIINILKKKIEQRLLSNNKIDSTAVQFLSPLLFKTIKFFILVCYIGFLGIETSSIAAAVTSAGLAIGLALQGSLSNFAGGFIILIMHPFKVGDYITTCGESGTVENIEVFYTTLVTIDNRVIKIPNGQVASSTIIDDNTKSIRRVDLVFSIGHNNDYELVKKIISECVDKTNLKLKDNPTFINIVDSNGIGIDITVRVWCKTKDYWDLYFMLLENIRLKFNECNIHLPSSYITVTNKSV